MDGDYASILSYFQGTETNKFLKETILITWKKQWSQYTKVAIVLIFTLFLVPNADATDALKTCACLLKECRYYYITSTSHVSEHCPKLRPL